MTEYPLDRPKVEIAGPSPELTAWVAEHYPDGAEHEQRHHDISYPVGITDGDGDLIGTGERRIPMVSGTAKITTEDNHDHGSWID